MADDRKSERQKKQEVGEQLADIRCQLSEKQKIKNRRLWK